MIILEEKDMNDRTGRSPSNMQRNKTRCIDLLVNTESEKDGEPTWSPNGSLQNSEALQCPPMSIIFVLFWTIGIISFGEYLFVNKIMKYQMKMQILIVNGNLETYLEMINVIIFLIYYYVGYQIVQTKLIIVVF